MAIEHGHRKLVDLPIDSMLDLSIVFCKRLPGRVIRQCQSVVDQSLWATSLSAQAEISPESPGRGPEMPDDYES
jgi:hypothetical protein